MRHILFVCLGNIIRSPAAEAIFKKMAEEKGLLDAFHIESRGCSRSQAGSLRDKRMEEAAKQKGYAITGCSTPITLQDLAFFDEIYAADRGILERLRSMATGEERKKIALFTAHSTKFKGQDIPDPYYEGSDGFQKVLSMIEDSCSTILTA